MSERLLNNIAGARVEAPSPLKTGIFAVASAVGGIVALDLASQSLWSKDATAVVAADDGQDLGTPRWLAVPGLGQKNGRFIREDLEGVLPGVVDYAHLSNRGITARKVGRALAEYYSVYYPQTSKPESRQNVLAHSMGLPTFLMGVEWCLNEGVAVPPIGVMMAFSSPLDARHTFMEKRVRMLAKYPYPGGALSKTGVEFYQRFEAEKFKMAALGRSVLGAMRCSYKDCSPPLWSSQIRTIADRSDYAADAFEGVITPETQIVHFGDVADRTVIILAARKGMSKLAESHGAALTIVDTPGEGHANISGSRKYVEQLLKDAA